MPYLPINTESSLIGGEGADRFVLRTSAALSMSDSELVESSRPRAGVSGFLGSEELSGFPGCRKSVVPAVLWFGEKVGRLGAYIKLLLFRGFSRNTGGGSL